MAGPNAPGHQKKNHPVRRHFPFVLLFALLGLSALASAPAAALEFELGAGPVDEIDGDGTWIATASWLTGQRHPWELAVGMIGARTQAQGVDTGDVYFVSVSRRLTWKRWFVQGGIAFTDSDNEVLSNHWQFRTGLGYDFGRFSLSVAHLSNANTGGRNRGETFALLQVAF